MEFLYPPSKEPSRIILLLIVFQEMKARMIWYEWDWNTPLRGCEMRAHRHTLPRDEWFPLLLIPLTKLSAFMIVCESRLTVYKDLLTGLPTQCMQRLIKQEEPEYPGFSKTPPLWVQWARSMRAQETNAVYLCREDGVIQCLIMDNAAEFELSSIHEAGKLGLPVNTAFAVLDVGPNTEDLLLVAGDMSQGGLFRTSKGKDPKLLHAIPNWTPLRNLTVTNDSGVAGTVPETNARPSCNPQQIFASVGSGASGLIGELHYGYEAYEMFSSVMIGDAISDGVLGIWAFHGGLGDTEGGFDGPGSRDDRTYILISHPTQTTLLHLRPKPRQLEKEDAIDDLEPEFATESIDLDGPRKTIFAGATANGTLVRVTESAIIIYLVSTERVKEEKSDDVDIELDSATMQSITTLSSYELSSPESRILTASIYHENGQSLLLFGVHTRGRFMLHMAQLENNVVPRGEPFYLPCQPSCVHVQRTKGIVLAYVATLDSNLSVYHIEEQTFNLKLTTSHKFTGSFAICDSIAIIHSPQDQETYDTCLVICGLRNGSIQTLNCNRIDNTETLTLCEDIHVGNTSVTVIADVTNKNRILLLCENHLCAMEYPQASRPRAPASIHNIRITNRDWPKDLLAFTQVANSWAPGENSGIMFGFLIFVGANDRLQVVELHQKSEPQIIFRSLLTCGNPKTVLHSTYLNKLVILYDNMLVCPARQSIKNPKRLGIRASQPTVTLLDSMLDPNCAEVDLDYFRELNDTALALERVPTEEFLGITEWFPKIEGSEHHLLIVNTKYTRHSKPAGRLLIFSISGRSGHLKRLNLKQRLPMDAPVYSVAVHPNRRSIVYCSGNDLFVHSLVPRSSGIKMLASAKMTMRSPARSLSIHESYIYVSSTRESLTVFKYVDNEIIYQYGDQSARDGLHHVLVPEKSLVLASDMTNTVVGLWQPPKRRIDNEMATVFEAILPSSINRLQRIARPIWYRDSANPETDETIIGSSEDGRIYQFEIISKGWRLLRFIQNMAERSEVVCPFKRQGLFKRRLTPTTIKPHFMRVNGDILQRVVDRGAEDLIQEMLDSELDLVDHTSIDSVQAKWELMKELAAEVVDIEDEDWLGKVVQWVRYQLRNAL